MTSGLHVTITPGEYYVSRSPVTIQTLLGSCVAACIYDPVNNIIGMNHFLLSNRRYARHMPMCLSEAGKYGMHAMELLINEMLKLGAERKRFKAKVFGGAAVMGTSEVKDSFFCVGDVNSRFIREYLRNDGIPLVAEDLGGEVARVIHFMHKDFSVHVKKLGITRAPTVVASEQQYWRRTLENQEKATPEIDIWE